MNAPTLKSSVGSVVRLDHSPASLRRTVRKSALLNVAIILTSLPVLVLSEGPRAILPALAIMAGISFLIWTATFALFSFVSLAQIFWTSALAGKPGNTTRTGKVPGLVDRWLDDPV